MNTHKQMPPSADQAEKVAYDKNDAISASYNNNTGENCQQDITTKYTYYLPEKNRKRRFVPDTPEEKKKANGARYKSYPSFEFPPEQDKLEPVRYGPLKFDFDNKDNPEIARTEALGIIHYCKEKYDVDPEQWQIHLSGSKGLHLELNESCFNFQGGDTHLPLIYKEFTKQLVEDLQLKTCDLSIYNMKSGKPFRIENVKRENGRYKVPVTYEELKEKQYDELYPLTAQPRQLERNITKCYSKRLFEVMLSLQHAVHHKPEPLVVKMAINLNGRLPTCINYIVEHCPPKSSAVNFNKLCLTIIPAFQSAELDLDIALATIDTFLQSYDTSDTYNTYKSRKAHFCDLWEYVEGNADYIFECSYVLGLKLPGTAFDCSLCPVTHAKNSVAVIDTIPVDQEVKSLPKELLYPGGLLGDIMDFTKRSSVVSHPLFNLAGAIALLGTMAGQKVMTETGLRTNFINIIIGYSSSGKDAPQSAIPRLLQGTHTASKLLGATELTSSAAILKDLEKNPVSLMIIDEVGMTMKSMSNPQSHIADIPRQLTKLFSSTDRGHTKRYSESKRDIELPYHHSSLLGATTPNVFYDSLTEGDISTGFIPRGLFFFSDHLPIIPSGDVDFTPDTNLAKQLDLITHIPTKVAKRVIVGGQSVEIPQPIIIERDKSADILFSDFQKDCHKLLIKHHQEPLKAAIYGRLAEHAAKLSLIHAVSRFGKTVKDVNKADVEWGIGLAEYLVDWTANSMHKQIADNDFHRLKRK